MPSQFSDFSKNQVRFRHKHSQNSLFISLKIRSNSYLCSYLFEFLSFKYISLPKKFVTFSLRLKGVEEVKILLNLLYFVTSFSIAVLLKLKTIATMAVHDRSYFCSLIQVLLWSQIKHLFIIPWNIVNTTWFQMMCIGSVN